MVVEICAYSLESCLVAQRAGAGRVELCSSLSEGGLTPSAGLIQLACRQLSIDLYVMIRPRGGDFLYSDTEFAVMQADIDMAKSLGADGIVLGLLKADGTVDEERTRQLVELAQPLPVTFHRAFDMTRDAGEALEAVIRAGAVTILTSGQQPSAGQGIEQLRQLVHQGSGRINIMAGAGVNRQNVGLLIEAGVQAVHLSGKTSLESPMTFRRAGLSMASAVLGEYERIESDEAIVRTIVEATKQQSPTR
ncbi:copper homeostasis protein CutC [Nibrella saemangeumensis]|uniref:PF03932 family protein CutC n=1 Tax=Nibrella saemangeumensis TaxID=1084526 RepID=A0ABP8MDW3_9BACT